LKFKHSGDLSTQPLGKVTTKPETKDIRQKIKVKKTLIGKAEHYYSKSKIAQFLMKIKNFQLEIKF
jgi:UPF0176 protein